LEYLLYHSATDDAVVLTSNMLPSPHRQNMTHDILSTSDES